MATKTATRTSKSPVDQQSFTFDEKVSNKEDAAADSPVAAREDSPLDTSDEEQDEPSTPTKRGKGDRAPRRATAESMAKQQREISVSEFFAKNRHLLGFDNKRKALLTTVKEAVDNSLDACEEAGILPDIEVIIEQTAEERYRVTVRDNGPGIVKQQIPNVFGKLLYGSKFHRLKMSRGQQGIGISAAGMYGLITTGKPVRIVSRTSAKAQAHMYLLAIDTKKNRPDIIEDQTVDVDWPHGTEVAIELEAIHQRGRQSVDEYLELTAIANPHAQFTFRPPDGDCVTFPRGSQELPKETREIKPHPYGIELGTFIKMLKETGAKKLSEFLTEEFSRVSPAVAKEVCAAAGQTGQTWVSTITPPIAEKMYTALQAVKLKAPATDCLAPMGAEAILQGLLRGIKAEFYTASTRPPAVYRGNPFQIEVGIAYGGELGSDKHDVDESDPNAPAEDDGVSARVIRFANRVPLLYQQSPCCLFKSVVDTKWNNYSLSQSSGALPRAPMVILIHMASVWVPFISEGKEAIADYDDIRKEVRLGISECGRRLSLLLKRKRRKADYSRRRDVFTRYIDEVVDAAKAMSDIDAAAFRQSLIDLSKTYTAQADMEFDDHGKIVRRDDEDTGLQDTIIIDRNNSGEMKSPDSTEALIPEVVESSEKATPKKLKKIGRTRRGK